jgi:protein-S-isoprenylcysteine O-methyltransferase Ste14
MMKVERHFGPDHPGIRIPPPLIFAACFASGLLPQRLLPAVALSRELRHTLGCPCLALSAWLAAWGLAWFLRLRTTCLPHKPNSALITAGPYRYSRNPLYLSAALLYAGLALWFGLLWSLLLLPAALIAVRFHVIAKEETYLERRFGREYLDYKTRVRRWL